MKHITLLLAFISILCLSSCGKRGSLEPDIPDNFPSTYPKTYQLPFPNKDMRSK